MEGRRISLWARSLLFRLFCYSVLNSIAITGTALLFWRVDDPPIGVSSWQSQAQALILIACVTFWLTFILAGVVLGLKSTYDSPPPQDKNC